MDREEVSKLKMLHKSLSDLVVRLGATARDAQDQYERAMADERMLRKFIGIPQPKVEGPGVPPRDIYPDLY